jgi:hypothetical protein
MRPALEFATKRAFLQLQAATGLSALRGRNYVASRTSRRAPPLVSSPRLTDYSFTAPVIPAT